MNTAVKRILVVGGNGFIGSAVCKAALSKGIAVTSVSSSGRPYLTPKGHSPAWTSKVDWKKGDALNPETFAHLFSEVSGVVHTLGTLLEDSAYKRAIRTGDIGGFFKSLVGVGKESNPLHRRTGSEEQRDCYESLNRDTAIRVCNEFVKSSNAEGVLNWPRTFVYLSAEDIYRPVIPARYIETKREAERGIEKLMIDNPNYRGVYIRPGLVYHAHLRPLTTPIATLLDVSAAVHRKVPRTLPTPSSILRSVGAAFHPASTSESELTSPLDSVANALVLPPIHVDQVAAAIIASLDGLSAIRGVVGVHRMREIIGWKADDE